MLERLAITAFVLAAWLAPARASACSCEPQSQGDALRTASVVFEGRVTSISAAAATADGVSSVAVAFSVARGWKGVEQETLTIRTPSDSAACGFAFRVSDDYLVYATERAGVAWVTLCGRTRAVADAAEDVRALGMGVTPVSTTPAPKEEGKATPSQPPARGGCAGCTVGATPSERNHAPAALAALAALAVLALAARLRLRSRALR